MARALTQIRLEEISGVDHPAQKKATMLITKRREFDRHMAPLREAIATVTGKPIQKQEQESEPMTIEKARGNFMQHVADIQKRDGISRMMAMEKASIEFPAEHQAYAHGSLAADPARTSGLRKAMQPGAELKKARGDFNAKVFEIMKRDGISTIRAMEKAAIEHPDLYQAYCSAE